MMRTASFFIKTQQQNTMNTLSATELAEARALSEKVLDGFNRHYARFRECAPRKSRLKGRLAAHPKTGGRPYRVLRRARG